MDSYSEWSVFMAQTFEHFLETLATYLPSLAAASLLVLLGWLVARASRALVLRLGAGVDRIAGRVGLAERLRAVRLPWSPSHVLGAAVYWLVILFFLTAAAESLGLPGFASWLAELIAYLPAVLAAAIVMLFGYLIASLLRDALTGGAGDTLGAREGRLLGQLAYVLVLIIALIIAVGHIGIDVTVLVVLLTMALGALLGALALAFGLGARNSVDNIIASHYLRSVYRIGQKVRIGEYEGELVDMTSTSVILDTPQGRVMIPARQFATTASVLLDAAADERTG